MPADNTLFPAGEAEEALAETLGVVHDAEQLHASPKDELIVQEGKAMMMLDEETMETAMICLVIAGLSIGLLNI